MKLLTFVQYEEWKKNSSVRARCFRQISAILLGKINLFLKNDTKRITQPTVVRNKWAQ